ncbi:MAG: ribosome silencing factor [Bacteroidetes bacterium QS_8_68_15]|nr:MAG: ribosome silencing factor [Bacteroidetes bacterium QS_8_68_15]
MNTTSSARSSSASSASARPDHAPAHELAACVVDAMTDRKATDITVLDLRSAGDDEGQTSNVADFFVLATGASGRQIRAVVNAVKEHVAETLGEHPWRTEGQEHMQWVVLDYVNVVAHVFSREKREYYDLERLWGDADTEAVPDDAGAAAVELLRSEEHAGEY